MADAEAASVAKDLITPDYVIGLMTQAVNDSTGQYSGTAKLNLPDTEFSNEYFKDLQDTFKLSQEEIRKAQEDQRTALEQQMGATESLGKNTAEAERAKGDRAQQLSDIAQRFVSLFGVSGNGDRIAVKAREYQELNDGVQKAATEIQDLQSVNFFDNPLQWIGNQLTLPSKINEYNVVANRVNSLESEINNDIALATAATNLNEQTVPTITHRMAEAAASVAVDNAKIQKEKLAEQRALSDANFANQRFANIAGMNSAAAQKAAKEIELSRMKYQEQVDALQRSASKSEHALRVAAIARSLLDDIQTQGLLDRYDQATGRIKGSTSMAAFKLMSQTQRESIISIAVGNGGVTPGDAFFAFKDAGIGPGLPMNQQNYLAYANRFMEDKMANDPTIKTMTRMEDKKAHASKLFNEHMVALEKNPTSGGPENPFRELSPKLMFAMNPALEDSVIGDIMKAYKDTDQAPDTNTIIETVRKQIPDDKLAAMAIAQWYSQNVMFRDTLTNYGAMGVKTSGTYRYSYTPSGPFSSPITVDLTKPALVERLLLQKRTDERIINDRVKGMEGIQF